MKDKNIVIISYHRYHELWQKMIITLKINLPNFNIYIITDENYDNINFADAYIIKTSIGDWSLGLLKGLEILKKKHGVKEALFTFDDLLITKVNNTEVIEKAFIEVRDENNNIVSVKLAHPHLGKDDYDEYFRYSKYDKYYTTLVYSIWDISFLINLLKNKFNPWSFEKEGYNYISEKDVILTSVKKIIHYDNVIVKGKMVKSFNYEFKEFSKMNFIEYYRYLAKVYLLKIYSRFKF